MANAASPKTEDFNAAFRQPQTDTLRDGLSQGRSVIAPAPTYPPTTETAAPPSLIDRIQRRNP